MRISNLRKSKDSIADLEMSNDERIEMLDYARRNIHLIEIEDFLVNWAFIDLLKKGIQREEKKKLSEYFNKKLLKDHLKNMKEFNKNRKKFLISEKRSKK